MSNPHRRDGWNWGPFTFRLPFYHTRLLWPEFLQGLLVSTATGLALVPILVGYFGLSFEEAVTATMLYSALLVASLYVFGEPYAPGWNTAALPLVMAFVFASYPDPVQRFQAMTALSINFAVLVFVLGITGLGKKLVTWLPSTLKAGIILGARRSPRSSGCSSTTPSASCCCSLFPPPSPARSAWCSCSRSRCRNTRAAAAG